MEALPRLIDFHSHYYNAAWYPSAPPRGSNVLAHAWPLLTNIRDQLEDMDDAGIDAKVLSAPAGVLVTPGQQLSMTLMKHINDHFGSDWPIMPIASRQKVEETLAAVKLADDQKAAIMSGNTLRLLKKQFHA